MNLKKIKHINWPFSGFSSCFWTSLSLPFRFVENLVINVKKWSKSINGKQSTHILKCTCVENIDIKKFQKLKTWRRWETQHVTKADDTRILLKIPTALQLVGIVWSRLLRNRGIDAFLHPFLEDLKRLATGVED